MEEQKEAVSEEISENKLSVWKKLSFSQKASVFSLGLLVLILPLTVFASLLQTKLFPRASDELPITPPIPPADCKTGLSYFRAITSCTENSPTYRYASFSCQDKYKEILGSKITCKSEAQFKRDATAICKDRNSTLNYFRAITGCTENSPTYRYASFTCLDKFHDILGSQNSCISEAQLRRDAEAICKQHPLCTPEPTPTVHPPETSTRVFVTSTTYNGNLGGLSGADAKCQERANVANLGGTWKAWLSDGQTSAKDRLAHSNLPYERIDGTIIANNWSDLVDGTLQNYINITEYGTPYTTQTWTNTKPDGSYIYSTDNATCSGWASNSGYNWAITGDSTSTNSNWTESALDYTLPCSIDMHLYCFEQPQQPTPTLVPINSPTPTKSPTPTTAALKCTGICYGSKANCNAACGKECTLNPPGECSWGPAYKCCTR